MQINYVTLRYTVLPLRYIRDAVRAGVSPRTWRTRWVMYWKRGEVNGMRVCVKMETWWDGKEVTNCTCNYIAFIQTIT